MIGALHTSGVNQEVKLQKTPSIYTPQKLMMLVIDKDLAIRLFAKLHVVSYASSAISVLDPNKKEFTWKALRQQLSVDT